MSLLALTFSVVLGATSPDGATPRAELPPAAALREQVATSAIGQETQSQQGEPRRRMRVIRLEELQIEGRIQKPQAFYLLQRSNLNFDDLNREESFLDKVVEAVEKPPF